MAELGILAVGRGAGALRYKHLDIPVQRVCGEPIRPDEADMVALAQESGHGLFTGADADRWRLVPRGLLPQHTQVLWAASQVASSDPGQLTSGWKRVMVVCWADDPALTPTLRALCGSGRAITVLLGGRIRPEDVATRRNHVVLSHLLRVGELAAVIHNSTPDRVLEVAVDTARNPTEQDYPRRKAVDLGPPLEIPSTWAIPAVEVPIFELVHVPLGQAQQLPQLLCDLASYNAIQGILGGPPIEVDGVPVVDLHELRATLPAGDVYAAYRDQISAALSTVQFVGEEPLVEQVARVLRPVLTEMKDLVETTVTIEQSRVLRLRAFGAAGIDYTCQRLRALLDDVSDHASRPIDSDFDGLVEGETAPDEGGVSELAWRFSFAGVPSYVVRRGQPGWQVARRLVKDRFAQFKGEFASAVASAFEARIVHARDPDSTLPAASVRQLHDRAVRVRDALERSQSALNSRILAGAEMALRQDGLLRWVARDPEHLRALLESQLGRLAVGPELSRNATVALSARPLGMADSGDFDAYLEEVVSAVNELPRSAIAVPRYASVLQSLLDARDPEMLRRHLTDDEGMDAVLSVSADTPPELMDWFGQTGMRMEVRVADPCAIYWRETTNFTSPTGELGRSGCNEHRLSDLLLPAPEGDSPHSLAAIVEAVAVLISGLIVGELSVSGEEGVRALMVSGGGLPPLSFLPHGAIHDLAVDPAMRRALRARVTHKLNVLPKSPDASEALQKLVELSALGPSTRVVTQLGLDHERYRHLMPGVGVLLERCARRATVAMLDHLKADEVRTLSTKPGRHAIVDVLQLSPLGV